MLLSQDERRLIWKQMDATKNRKYAYKNNISLKEACTTLGFLSEEKFEKVFHPEQMV